VNVQVGAATDIGLVREGNEDSYLVEQPLFAVADGMGGHRGGEVASRLALETIESLFRRGEGALAEQVQEANRAVYERSSMDRAVAGMGTTLTAALVEADRARLAHVGDSRAYLFRRGELRMLTEDHTLVNRMVQQGEITEAEAERHPQRSVVTRALGVERSVPVDEVIVDLEPGDRLLICSDGLTSMVDDAAIADLLGHQADPQRAAETLVDAANRAGGVDNTTVIVVAVEDGDDPAPPPTGRRDTLVAPAPAPAPPGRATPREPKRARERRPWGRIAVVAGIVVAAVVLGLVGLRWYLDSQWYVGVANGHVAIYQGIPADVAGFELHHVVVETTIPAADAERLAIYRTQLPDGITAEDRTDAEQIVSQIRKDVAAASVQPTKKTGGS
jgi:PPM family protein phosphatase